MEDSEDVPNLSGEDSDGWDEIETTGEQTVCLFCSSQFRTIAVALNHCRTEHDFDLLDLKMKYNMDCYSFIKMVNYIRQHKPDPKMLMNQVSDVPVWNDDKYLKPSATETWLMYDFEDLGSTPSTPNNTIDTNKPLPSMSLTDLERTVAELKHQLIAKDSFLFKALEDMNRMKEITNKLLEHADVSTESSEDNISNRCVGSIHPKGDESYFSSYSHFGIHYEMLSDNVRTESYRDAILNNNSIFKDKTVLDLGCGTGILSMFAAQAGAKTVWGLDESEIVYKAMDIIRENKLEDTIHLVRGKLEDGQLPFEEVDIIVSEWMGYFLLFEGMLDSVIHARKKYLKPGGFLLPNRCNISLIGVSDLESHNKYINFWNNVYGFSMKCMIPEVVNEASISTVAAETIVTKSVILTEIDITNCDINAVNFVTTFFLEIMADSKLTALVGYFDTFFDLPNAVSFSTGPKSKLTHWKQTVFYLKDPIDVKKGDTIPGTFTCNRHIKDIRGLKVTIELHKKKYHYTIN